MKIHCAKCGIDEELNPDELKEVSEFVLKNNLDAIDYLNYIALKRGKVCTDKKKHTFLFNVEWQENLIKLTREVKSLSEHHILNEKLIENLKSKVKELEHQIESKITENTDLNLKKSNNLERVIETTGNNNLELWK